MFLMLNYNWFSFDSLNNGCLSGQHVSREADVAVVSSLESLGKMRRVEVNSILIELAAESLEACGISADVAALVHLESLAFVLLMQFVQVLSEEGAALGVCADLAVV